MRIYSLLSEISNPGLRPILADPRRRPKTKQIYILTATHKQPALDTLYFRLYILAVVCELLFYTEIAWATPRFYVVPRTDKAGTNESAVYHQVPHYVIRFNRSLRLNQRLSYWHACCNMRMESNRFCYPSRSFAPPSSEPRCWTLIFVETFTGNTCF